METCRHTRHGDAVQHFVQDWKTYRLYEVTCEEYAAFVADPERNPDHPVYDTPESRDAYCTVLARAKKAEAEVEKLKGSAGLDELFHWAAIAERDYYKMQLQRIHGRPD